MANIAAWALLVLGITHVLVGVAKFKRPLHAALSGGFINQFKEIHAYAAFWFLMSGPPLMLSGHLAIHAVAVHDLYVLEIIGLYTLVPSLIGVIAFPKSPFWAAITLSIPLIAAGRGLLA